MKNILVLVVFLIFLSQVYPQTVTWNTTTNCGIILNANNTVMTINVTQSFTNTSSFPCIVINRVWNVSLTVITNNNNVTLSAPFVFHNNSATTTTEFCQDRNVTLNVTNGGINAPIGIQSNISTAALRLVVNNVTWNNTIFYQGANGSCAFSSNSNVANSRFNVMFMFNLTKRGCLNNPVFEFNNITAQALVTTYNSTTPFGDPANYDRLCPNAIIRNGVINLSDNRLITTNVPFGSLPNTAERLNVTLNTIISNTYIEYFYTYTNDTPYQSTLFVTGAANIFINPMNSTPSSWLYNATPCINNFCYFDDSPQIIQEDSSNQCGWCGHCVPNVTGSLRQRAYISRIDSGLPYLVFYSVLPTCGSACNYGLPRCYSDANYKILQRLFNSTNLSNAEIFCYEWLYNTNISLKPLIVVNNDYMTNPFSLLNCHPNGCTFATGVVFLVNRTFGDTSEYFIGLYKNKTNLSCIIKSETGLNLPYGGFVLRFNETYANITYGTSSTFFNFTFNVRDIKNVGRTCNVSLNIKDRPRDPSMFDDLEILFLNALSYTNIGSGTLEINTGQSLRRLALMPSVICPYQAITSYLDVYWLSLRNFCYLSQPPAFCSLHYYFTDPPTASLGPLTFYAPEPGSYLYAFTFRNSNTNALISKARIEINNVFVTFSSTDGTATVALVPGLLYTIKITAPNYYPLTFSYVPSLQQAITLYLQPIETGGGSGSGPTYQELLRDILAQTTYFTSFNSTTRVYRFNWSTTNTKVQYGETRCYNASGSFYVLVNSSFANGTSNQTSLTLPANGTYVCENTLFAGYGILLIKDTIGTISSWTGSIRDFALFFGIVLILTAVGAFANLPVFAVISSAFVVILLGFLGFIPLSYELASIVVILTIFIVLLIMKKSNVW